MLSTSEIPEVIVFSYFLQFFGIIVIIIIKYIDLKIYRVMFLG